MVQLFAVVGVLVAVVQLVESCDPADSWLAYAVQRGNGAAVSSVAYNIMVRVRQISVSYCSPPPDAHDSLHPYHRSLHVDLI